VLSNLPVTTRKGRPLSIAGVFPETTGTVLLAFGGAVVATAIITVTVLAFLLWRRQRRRE
jgi:hypothetical protein